MTLSLRTNRNKRAKSLKKILDVGIIRHRLKYSTLTRFKEIKCESYVQGIGNCTEWHFLFLKVDFQKF